MNRLSFFSLNRKLFSSEQKLIFKLFLIKEKVILTFFSLEQTFPLIDLMAKSIEEKFLPNLGLINLVPRIKIAHGPIADDI